MKIGEKSYSKIIISNNNGQIAEITESEFTLAEDTYIFFVPKEKKEPHKKKVLEFSLHGIDENIRIIKNGSTFDGFIERFAELSELIELRLQIKQELAEIEQELSGNAETQS